MAETEKLSDILIIEDKYTNLEQAKKTKGYGALFYATNMKDAKAIFEENPQIKTVLSDRNFPIDSKNEKIQYCSSLVLSMCAERPGAWLAFVSGADEIDVDVFGPDELYDSEYYPKYKALDKPAEHWTVFSEHGKTKEIWQGAFDKIKEMIDDKRQKKLENEAKKLEKEEKRRKMIKERKKIKSAHAEDKLTAKSQQYSDAVNRLRKLRRQSIIRYFKSTAKPNKQLINKLK